jgi:hypothetical protein
MAAAPEAGFPVGMGDQWVEAMRLRLYLRMPALPHPCPPLSQKAAGDSELHPVWLCPPEVSWPWTKAFPSEGLLGPPLCKRREVEAQRSQLPPLPSPGATLPFLIPPCLAPHF